jgi:hypothetical protein
MNSGKICKTEQVTQIRVSIADEVLSRAEYIGDRTFALVDKAGQKLERICRDSQLCNQCEEKEAVREYPKYFADLENKLDRIESNLRMLEDIISRCEV